MLVQDNALSARQKQHSQRRCLNRWAKLHTVSPVRQARARCSRHEPKHLRMASPGGLGVERPRLSAGATN